MAGSSGGIRDDRAGLKADVDRSAERTCGKDGGMMKILLVQIDETRNSNPNLALEKIAIFYKAQGHEIIWNFPMAAASADRIFVSCIFDWNFKEAQQWTLDWPTKAIIGGSGFNVKSELPQEIEDIKPHINWGFTTRGCIRNCPFCIVRQKEGDIRVVGDLFDLWDGKGREVTVLDNNILAVPDHFKLVCKQAKEKKIRLDFNQGLDFRLLTPEIVHELKITRTKRYRFAFDEPAFRPGVEFALQMLRDGGINECLWYVLVGFDTTLQDDFDRLNFLKSRKQKVYLQRYSRSRAYVPMAQWANQQDQFAMKTFREFLKSRPNGRTYEPFFENIDTERMVG